MGERFWLQGRKILTGTGDPRFLCDFGLWTERERDGGRDRTGCARAGHAGPNAKHLQDRLFTKAPSSGRRMNVGAHAAMFPTSALARPLPRGSAIPVPGDPGRRFPPPTFACRVQAAYHDGGGEIMPRRRTETCGAPGGGYIQARGTDQRAQPVSFHADVWSRWLLFPGAAAATSGTGRSNGMARRGWP